MKIKSCRQVSSLAATTPRAGRPGWADPGTTQSATPRAKPTWTETGQGTPRRGWREDDRERPGSAPLQQPVTPRRVRSARLLLPVTVVLDSALLIGCFSSVLATVFLFFTFLIGGGFVLLHTARLVTAS